MTEFEHHVRRPDRTEIIATFIALLEMARLKKMKIYQNNSLRLDLPDVTEALTELDPSLVTGFEYNNRRASRRWLLMSEHDFEREEEKLVDALTQLSRPPNRRPEEKAEAEIMVSKRSRRLPRA